MRFKRATAAILLAIGLLVGVGAGTASAADNAPPTPTVTYQAYDMTLWYSKSDVRSAHSLYGLSMSSHLAAFGCGYLPYWAAKGTCGAVVVTASYWITNTFAEAADNGQCVWITVEY